MKDLHHNLTFIEVVAPFDTDASTPVVGTIIDTIGYEGLEFVLTIGNLYDADATFTVLVEEGSVANLSDATAVADADLLGTEAAVSFQFNDDNKIRKIGYVGGKRYVRLTITPANNSVAAYLGVIGVLGYPENLPVA